VRNLGLRTLQSLDLCARACRFDDMLNRVRANANNLSLRRSRIGLVGGDQHRESALDSAFADRASA